ncbi:protein tyrosine phosphatase type IVA 3 [Pteropus vampyrus]|uniref:Protein tyrosine phosphatase type IVA 3 n=1 Tax=Pteropus vampyrus TaxID=132908 RepID=A0A6P3RKK7_PTEVA|nr:protein tyrosine phosphatase type IVA 3 [Pteropus vampyrus]
MARMNRPAPVEVTHKNMRFLITHNPTNATLGSFIEDLKKYGATTVVRVCEVTYDKAPLEKDGITVVDLKKYGATTVVRVCEVTYDKAPLEKDGITVVVRVGCRGEGRVPRKRRGAINSKQLMYLEKYRPRQRLRFKEPHTHKTKCCVM